MGRQGKKWHLVITFDRGVLTNGQRFWTAFCKIFSGTPHLTIFGAPKYVYLAKYGQIDLKFSMEPSFAQRNAHA